jgi:molecular chaperone DnaJ
VFKLRGKGIPHLRGGGSGDQLVRLKVKTPAQLSSKEKKLIEEFAELRGEASKDKSLFDYVKRLF